MEHLYDVFPYKMRTLCIDKVQSLMYVHGLSKEEAIKRYRSFRKRYGDVGFREARMKKMVMSLRKKNPEKFGSLSYATEEDKIETRKIVTREKRRIRMQKYFESNRMYQRLSGRIHTALVKGDMELVEKLKKERDLYRKTDRNGNND